MCVCSSLCAFLSTLICVSSTPLASLAAADDLMALSLFLLLNAKKILIVDPSLTNACLCMTFCLRGEGRSRNRPHSKSSLSTSLSSTSFPLLRLRQTFCSLLQQSPSVGETVFSVSSRRVPFPVATTTNSSQLAPSSVIQTKLGGPSQPLVQIQVTRSQTEFGQNPQSLNPTLNQSINSHNQPNATQGKPPIQTIASGLMPPKQNVLLKQLLQNCPSAESGTKSPNSNTPGS